jgi:sialic acid synthase SpsE
MAEAFGPPAHKIASMDSDNIPLIRYIAKTERPVLVSTGMADLGEIRKIVEIFREEKK